MIASNMNDYVALNEHLSKKKLEIHARLRVTWQYGFLAAALCPVCCSWV